MKIVKLEWRNIFSYGDDITTLDLGEDGKLWQLSGKSGAGKSSLLAIPKILLFGKTEGSDGKPVNVGDIANRFNKKGWIRGTIINGSNTYIIERTFAPSGLSILKNGENLDQAGIKNMQGIIENEIIDGMPYNIFANVMTLSLNNFKSFISMTPTDKRLIVDKIFSLEIVDKVHELVKKDMRDLGNSINTSNGQIYSLNRAIETSNNELNNVKNIDNTDHKDEIEKISANIDKLNELETGQNELYKDGYKIYTEIVNCENSNNALITQVKYDIGQIEGKIRLFNEEKCPTCGTPFNSAEFEHIRQELSESLEEHKKAKKGYEDQSTVIANSKREQTEYLNSIQDNIKKIQSKRTELTIRLRTIEESSKAASTIESINKIIADTENHKKAIEDSIKESSAKMKLLETIEGLYSVDGIKQAIMGTYIPTLNEEIDETLRFLEFPYTLTFDNDFNPHLQHLCQDIKPQSLSTGEHKKIDLTVLCSLLKMIKRKYPQINMVCLDEAVSSLDYESSTEIIKYLREISSDMNMNIFVVSHTQLDENLFDEHLLVEKHAEYSVLKRV